MTVECANVCGCSALSAGPTIGVTWLTTVGGQIRSGVLGTLIYEGVKLDEQNSLERRFFIFYPSLHHANKYL
jgi:hypothetical protein